VAKLEDQSGQCKPIMSELQHPNPAQTYERYFGPTIADPWTRVLLEYTDVQPRQHVLDLACGTGSVARHIAPLVGTEGKVVALDINPEMLAVGQTLPAPSGATIEWWEGSAVAIDLPSAIFDLVVCQQGLQFFTDRAASLRETRRVLADGGRVVLSVWQGLQLHPLYEALFEATTRRLDANLTNVATPFSLGDAEELRALLNEAGFHTVKVTPRSIDVHLPAPAEFVQRTVLGAATSVPTFAQLDTAGRSALVESVSQEIGTVVQRYQDGNRLTFPMFSHIAVAYA